MIHSDSKSMLDKLQEMRTWPYYYPNATMEAEWDILQAMISTIQKFDQPPQFQHVTGHQDRKTAYNNLPLPAQLNVDADALAGSFEYETSKDPTRIPRIEGNTAQLHFHGGTVSSNYRRALRKVCSRPSLKAHILKRNGWTERQYNYIDWDVHGLNIRKHYYRKHFFIKYIHDWLPLGKLLSKYKPENLSKCPSCTEPIEDRTHFLRCKERSQWHDDLHIELQIFLDQNNTRPALADILQDSLHCWLADHPVVLSGYPTLFTSLIEKQNAVGWDQLLLGRFVLEWKELQEDYLSTLSKRDKHQTGTTWVTQVNTIIWKHVYLNWKHRNSVQHGVDAASREAILLDSAKRETEALYDIRDEVLPRDHDLYYGTIDEHMERETTSRGLRQWLNTWKPVLLHSVKEGKRLGTNGMRSIRQYFQNTNTTTPPAPTPT
jgi:hypothetical protein